MIKTHEVLALQKALLNLDKICATIDYTQIRIASPQQIKIWSLRKIFSKKKKSITYITGNVLHPRIFDFVNLIPIEDGLFCQKIFGPIKDNICGCLKRKLIKNTIINKICINCNVELIESRVRRYRMGNIELIYPLSHIWYLKGNPSYLVDILQCLNIDEEMLKDPNRVIKKTLTFKEIKSIIYSHGPLSSMDGYSKHPLFKIYENLSFKFNHISSNREKKKKKKYSKFITNIKNLCIVPILENNKALLRNPEIVLSIKKKLKKFKIKLTIQKIKKIIGNHYKKRFKTIYLSLSKTYYSNSLLELHNDLPKLNIKQIMNINKIFKPTRMVTGVEVIKSALESLNINHEIIKARELAINRISTNRTSGKSIEFDFVSVLRDYKNLFQRIRILESFIATKTELNWMILTIIPVLPPGLRPIYEIEDGKLLLSDINEFYRYIIIKMHQLLVRYRYNLKYINTKKIQEGVDALINNAKSFKVLGVNDSTALISLTEILEGKYGRFRHNILGKRVDFSGRTVIAVGPSLRLNQCGLPVTMALELFKPFLIHELLKNITINDKTANYILNKKKPYIWLLLMDLANKHTILLNRAPTLHKHGVQAFTTLLVLDSAIYLHPLVCTGFNADFDGDQMAIHLPIHNYSQIEASLLMKPSSNLISQANGELILKPTQDIIIGNYYLTLMFKRNRFISLNWFANEEEVLTNFSKKKISLHARVLVRYSINDVLVKIFLDKLKILNCEAMDELKLIKINNVFKAKRNYYILTDLGILVARKKKNFYYKIEKLFLETSPGRILFSRNLKNFLKIL